MKKKDSPVLAATVEPNAPVGTRVQKVRSASLWHKEIMADLEPLAADYPMGFDEFQLALNEARPGHTISVDMQRKLHGKLSKRFEERWRALGLLDHESANVRVYSPCLELVQALSRATGLSQPETIEFVLRDFASQVSSGRFNFVESIVSTKLQSNVVVSAATRILDKIDLSTDPRLHNFAQIRLDQRKRNLRFKHFVPAPVSPNDEVV